MLIRDVVIFNFTTSPKGERWTVLSILRRVSARLTGPAYGLLFLCPVVRCAVRMDFMIELFRKAKEKGIHTTIDTSGAPFTREEPFFGKFNELMRYTDLLLVDIKHIDEEQHKVLTGRTNANILDMARYLSEIGKPVWIRHVLVPERNDDDTYLEKLYDFISALKNVQKVEVLPYHTFGEYKWKELGYDYPLAGIDPPSKERVENANRILHTGQQITGSSGTGR